jgi:phosphoserine phosphatase RsbU/P
MDTVASPPRVAADPRSIVQAEWIRAVPTELRETLLRPRDMARLLEWADRFVEEGRAEVLAEMDAEVYRLAGRLEERVGQEATLRYLRDGLLRALAPLARGAPPAAERVERIVCRVTDAAWRSHTDALEETIRRQQYEKLRQELTLAKRIQERLLPKSIPDIPGFDIAGKVLPAAEVGGDYWSCKIYPDDNVVTFKLADVTGHGIAAATLVAAVKFISGGYYRGSTSAAQVMERTNQVLVRETPNEILVTMVYGWLRPDSRTVTIVNAGHAPVLHLRNDGEYRRIDPTGVALGMIQTRYREVTLEMEPGDIFFTCSDGVTEPSADGALGETWVRKTVAQARDLRAAQIVDRVLEEALRFYGSPLDDMSVLVIKRTA